MYIYIYIYIYIYVKLKYDDQARIMMECIVIAMWHSMDEILSLNALVVKRKLTFE